MIHIIDRTKTSKHKVDSKLVNHVMTEIKKHFGKLDPILQKHVAGQTLYLDAQHPDDYTNELPMIRHGSDNMSLPSNRKYSKEEINDLWNNIEDKGHEFSSNNDSLMETMLNNTKLHPHIKKHWQEFEFQKQHDPTLTVDKYIVDQFTKRKEAAKYWQDLGVEKSPEYNDISDFNQHANETLSKRK